MRVYIGGSDRSRSRRTRAYVERRARFALSRFGAGVVRVQVRLSDEEGPRGRVERVCRVVAAVRGAAPFVVEHRDERMEPAVDRALERVARQVARTMERLDRTWKVSEDR
jgi:ribosome-associated translation inhibitor RaiA